ncbi:TonB-dependent receptor [Phenylobacterium sp.]|jgi:iron complex outermembrane receptor protein|uniref:TonB-dependent receptor n=1 Tax=Phenylobacterium sp. TaxID=1871053 RepID=UPI00160A8687
MTTVDVNGIYAFRQSGALHGLEFSLGVRNLFNAPPDTINTTQPYDVSYDSVNYSPMGRMVSVAVRKRW